MGLDSVELVMSVEEAFKIEIDDEDAQDLITVGRLHRHVVSLLQAKGESVNPDKIYDQLRALIVEQLAVDPASVVPEARFVQDLKID